MRTIRVDLNDETYWILHAWADREHRKTHEQAALLIERAIEAEQPHSEPQPETAA